MGSTRDVNPMGVAPDSRRSSAAQRLGQEWSVTVVVTCYDLPRIEQTQQCIQAVAEQDYPASVVVVVDHNRALGERLKEHLPTDVTMMSNERARGASGARNSAALKADTDLVAFVDDDAYPDPDWLRRLAHSMDDERLVGAGGTIVAEWLDKAPRWFPPAFGWVVGGSIPSSSEDHRVRNVWAGNMIVRTAAFQAAGGFREAWGKVGDGGEPEDTELSLRLAGDSRQWLFVPDAVVHHRVSPRRATIRFFLHRCRAEGRGKARLRRIHKDNHTVLAAERRYLVQDVPMATIRHLGEFLHGDPSAAGRAALCVGGTAATLYGFAHETVRLRWKRK